MTDEKVTRQTWPLGDFGRGRKDSRRVGYSEMVRWVLDRVDVTDEDLDPRDAPSPGAWSMLQWVRRDEAARKEFFKTILPRAVKMDDGEDDVEGGGERLERGRVESLEKLIERVERVFAAAGVSAPAESPFS